MRVILSMLLLSLATSLYADVNWFIKLPDYPESNISFEYSDSSYRDPIAKEPPSSFPWFSCGLVAAPELSEADQLLNDPRTIDFIVRETYEVYIPIMGDKPVAVYRNMQVVDRKFDAWWGR